MKKQSFVYRAFHLYYDGFRQMTLGRTLWAVILVKMAVIFLVLKLFFFPDYIKTHSQRGQESRFVSEQVLKRAP